jgi:hypothetical protein
MVHYLSDTSFTCIEYPSANPYSTYTMYNPADICSNVLNDIMSLYNHNYQILGLNSVLAQRQRKFPLSPLNSQSNLGVRDWAKQQTAVIACVSI